MGLFRQEYWSGLPLPSQGDLPDPRIELSSLALQANSLSSEPPGKPYAFHKAAYNDCSWASQEVQMVKNPPANVGDIRHAGSIPGLARCPGEGHGNPLQYSCLENPHRQKSIAGYSPWGRKVLGMIERLSTESLFYSMVYNLPHEEEDTRWLREYR